MLCGRARNYVADLFQRSYQAPDVAAMACLDAVVACLPKAAPTFHPKSTSLQPAARWRRVCLAAVEYAQSHCISGVSIPNSSRDFRFLPSYAGCCRELSSISISSRGLCGKPAYEASVDSCAGRWASRNDAHPPVGLQFSRRNVFQSSTNAHFVMGGRSRVIRKGTAINLDDNVRNQARSSFHYSYRAIHHVWSDATISKAARIFPHVVGHVFYQSRTIHTTVPIKQGMVYQEDGDRPPRLLVVQPRIHPESVLRARLFEALRLADSLEGLRGEAGGQAQKQLPPYVLVQNPEHGKSKKRRKRVRADAYFGAGTIENVRVHVVADDSQDGLDAVFVNAILSAVQQRNLERVWGKPVLDRVGLIIEIFGAHAETKEARLQVELAALNYKRSRLVRMPSKDGRLTFGMDFEDEVVSARGRGSGGRGFISGAGETEIQLQRRRISERKVRLLTMLGEVRRTRALHRAARQKHGMGGHGNRLPVVAVVGYTNAGKSSLVAALSQSNLYIDDKLFATLDPRSRSVDLPSGQKVILSDTVGFISDLPIQLVEAFHATLEEVVEADFLLHVIDSSAPNADEQRITVLQVLESIGVSQEKLNCCMIEAWNKVDLSSTSCTANPPDSLKLDRLETGAPLLPLENMAKDGPSSEEDNATPDILVESENPVGIENSATEDSVEYIGLSWSHGVVPRVGTSAVEGIGLKELLHLLDKKLVSRPRPYAEIGI